VGTEYDLVDPGQLLPQMVARHAQERPSEPFLEHVDGGSLTYGQTDELACRWAGALASLGVERGDRVMTMLEPGLDNTPLWLGIAWLGAIDTGVNTDYRGAMLRYVLEHARARVIVVDEALVDRIVEVAPQLDDLPTVVVLGGDDGPDGPDGPDRPGLGVPTRSAAAILAAADPLDVGVEPAPWDIACMIYTSGTTGPSKGVLIPWAQLHAMAVGVFPTEDFGDDEAYYSPFTMYHVSGRLPPFNMALCGGRVVVRQRMSLTQGWSDIRTHRCTTAIVAGLLTQQLMDQPAGQDDAELPLRRAVIGPVPPNINEFADRFGVKVCTAFNMTEISAATWAGWDIENHLSCGRAREGYPGYHLRLVDEHDVEVPVGEVGELIVRTDVPWTLNAGYFADPERTAQAWRNGWFHTGDAFRRDEDGNFFFVDRMKDCIRRRGENISSFEVEMHVTEHPEVVEVAAIAVPDERSGDEVKVVVVRKPGSELTPEELAGYLIPRMPRFMVPRYIEMADELPKTQATMKVRKVELRHDPFNEATWDREAAGITVPR